MCKNANVCTHLRGSGGAMSGGLLTGSGDLALAAEVVVRNLSRRYDAVPERMIKREVGRAFAGFSDAKVTNFVPVLAEREAVRRLDQGSGAR
ncbi:MAG TPA: hypothetical protein VG076_09910 [Acidimicrobiales bacterium]|nr:hypothetical protein [Acidimicrobiales bacterium]